MPCGDTHSCNSWKGVSSRHFYGGDSTVHLKMNRKDHEGRKETTWSIAVICFFEALAVQRI